MQSGTLCSTTTRGTGARLILAAEGTEMLVIFCIMDYWNKNIFHLYWIGYLCF